MFGKRKVRKQEPSPYAMRSDFCRIFEKDMNRLYLLSLLLTGDRTIAEQCFVGGLHISQEGNQVFKEWAESWARRAIIQNAIRMIRPRKIADTTHSTAHPSSSNGLTEHTEIAGIVDLSAFRTLRIRDVSAGTLLRPGMLASSRLHPRRRGGSANSSARAIRKIRRSSPQAGEHRLEPKGPTRQH